MNIESTITLAGLQPALERLFEASASKIRKLDRRWNPKLGTPVFTRNGEYTTRGWTEWTQGFQFGSALYQYEATGEQEFLDLGRRGIREVMASHVSHVGVHDHGFNNVSTYGNLWRLIREGRASTAESDLGTCELALKVSGAIQAARWTRIANDGGFIYSFNGPHSLFVDTIRSLRSLALAHQLGHALMGEGDRRISLLERLVQHATATARYSVYYGEGRDVYDVAGRVVHEAIFNVNDGTFRCPSTQQGYSPFTTWTRGHAWAVLGFAELLEYVATLGDADLALVGGRPAVIALLERAARVTSDYYLEFTPSDGIPYWDTGAPGLAFLGDYRSRPADPFNPYEPVDSSAAAISAQGLLRLGRYLRGQGDSHGERYWQAGLTVVRTLLSEPYLSTDPNHEGLLLHVIYHRPNGWDYVPPGAKVPRGESAMWGDYHLRELAVMLWREARGAPYLTFFGP
ncbi:MAG TPA: glycosyl hydrolase [Chloroflexota bacterium]|nr:glycosyl hydrolase [Chloroflexota bacterium]